jgi:peptide/nickel transport system permease protein
MLSAPRHVVSQLNLPAKIGLAVIAVVWGAALVMFLDPHLTNYNPLAFNYAASLRPPSLTYPFGTDYLGRSLSDEVLSALPIDISSSIVAVGVDMTFGAVLGATAGYLGGRTEELIMRVTDLFLSFPGLILAVAISYALGPDVLHALYAIMIVSWPGPCRYARAEALVVRSQAFVKAARLSGKGSFFIMRKHVFPNIAPTLVTIGSVELGSVLLVFSALGYLGLGAQPPAVQLGLLVYYGQTYIRTAPWYALIPGGIILAVAMSYNFLADGLRDVLDPTRRR